MLQDLLIKMAKKHWKDNEEEALRWHKRRYGTSKPPPIVVVEEDEKVKKNVLGTKDIQVGQFFVDKDEGNMRSIKELSKATSAETDSLSQQRLKEEGRMQEQNSEQKFKTELKLKREMRDSWDVNPLGLMGREISKINQEETELGRTQSDDNCMNGDREEVTTETLSRLANVVKDSLSCWDKRLCLVPSDKQIEDSLREAATDYKISNKEFAPHFVAKLENGKRVRVDRLKTVIKGIGERMKRPPTIVELRRKKQTNIIIPTIVSRHIARRERIKRSVADTIWASKSNFTRFRGISTLLKRICVQTLLTSIITKKPLNANNLEIARVVTSAMENEKDQNSEIKYRTKRWLRILYQVILQNNERLIMERTEETRVAWLKMVNTFWDYIEGRIECFEETSEQRKTLEYDKNSHTLEKRMYWVERALFNDAEETELFQVLIKRVLPNIPGASFLRNTPIVAMTEKERIKKIVNSMAIIKMEGEKNKLNVEGTADMTVLILDKMIDTLTRLQEAAKTPKWDMFISGIGNSNSIKTLNRNLIRETANRYVVVSRNTTEIAASPISYLLHKLMDDWDITWQEVELLAYEIKNQVPINKSKLYQPGKVEGKVINMWELPLFVDFNSKFLDYFNLCYQYLFIAKVVGLKLGNYTENIDVLLRVPMEEWTRREMIGILWLILQSLFVSKYTVAITWAAGIVVQAIYRMGNINVTMKASKSQVDQFYRKLDGGWAFRLATQPLEDTDTQGIEAPLRV